MFCGKIRCRYIPPVKPVESVKTVKTVETFETVETFVSVKSVKSAEPCSNYLSIKKIEQFIYHYNTDNSIME